MPLSANGSLEGPDGGFGSGTAVSRDAEAPRRLRLLEARTFGTGVVLLR